MICEKCNSVFLNKQEIKWWNFVDEITKIMKINTLVVRLKFQLTMDTEC